MTEQWQEMLTEQQRKKICVKCGAEFVGRRCLACKKVSDAAWKKANVERIKIVDAQWVKNNPEKVAATKKRYAERHPDRRKKSKAAWQSANKDRMLAHGHNRRAKIKSVGGKISLTLKDSLYKLQKGKCACCKEDLSKKKPHLDHIMPIARGGSNTDENMQLLCSSCNQSKNAKHPIDFMQSRGFLL
jgi:5-methylcytosine-specific restriction endonuclease McrA